MSSRCLKAAVALLALIGCEREQRRFHDVAVTRSGYQDNAWAVSEGKRLFSQMNCVGCHARGGGGIGPPLMDADWIYGSTPEHVFQTITQGRPNGMPSFGDKLPNQQVWQLVAYVRSMSGLLMEDVAPGRGDEMQMRSPEQATEPTP